MKKLKKVLFWVALVTCGLAIAAADYTGAAAWGSFTLYIFCDTKL